MEKYYSGSSGLMGIKIKAKNKKFSVYVLDEKGSKRPKYLFLEKSFQIKQN